MAFYQPDTAQREAALAPAAAAACLFVDVQRYNCSQEGAIYRSLTEAQRSSEGTRHFFERVQQCEPLWASLQAACRCGGAGVGPVLRTHRPHAWRAPHHHHPGLAGRQALKSCTL